MLSLAEVTYWNTEHLRLVGESLARFGIHAAGRHPTGFNSVQFSGDHGWLSLDYSTESVVAGLLLRSIQSTKRGYGTTLLTALCSSLDECGVGCYLWPIPIHEAWVRGASRVTTDGLRNWYERNGWDCHLPYLKDATEGEAMYRFPKGEPTIEHPRDDYADKCSAMTLHAEPIRSLEYAEN